MHKGNGDEISWMVWVIELDELWWNSENGGIQSGDSKEDVRECTSGKKIFGSLMHSCLVWILKLRFWWLGCTPPRRGCCQNGRCNEKPCPMIFPEFQQVEELTVVFTLICMWTSVNITSRTWLMEMIMSILLFQIVVWYLGCSRKLHLGAIRGKSVTSTHGISTWYGHKHVCSFLHHCGVNLYDEVTYYDLYDHILLHIRS